MNHQRISKYLLITIVVTAICVILNISLYALPALWETLFGSWSRQPSAFSLMLTYQGCTAVGCRLLAERS